MRWIPKITTIVQHFTLAEYNGLSKVIAHYIPITWTFFRATDVLSNRYLARYTSLNWPRPIFFSIWKFASELWPISGCNGFWKTKKTKQFYYHHLLLIFFSLWTFLSLKLSLNWIASIWFYFSKFVSSSVCSSVWFLPQQTGSSLCCWDPGPAVEPGPTESGGPGLPHKISVETQRCQEIQQTETEMQRHLQCVYMHFY